MRRLYPSLLFFLLVLGIGAQTPSYWNYNVTGGANAFPFGTTTSRKVQWRINANSLAGTSGPVTAGNNITVVYFMTGNASSNLYPLINISLKQGPAQFAGGGNYETGMTLVYSGTNVTKTGTTGGWISFTLTTPFLYDPTLPLFVEVEHNATSGTGPTVYQTSPAGPGFGRLYGNYPNATYTGADQTVAHFGVDVLPATPCVGAPPMNTVAPQSFTTCPGLNNPNIGFASTYSFGGLNFIWQSSTVSPVGPWTAIPGATMHFAPTPTIGTTTWYQAVVTCTNPGGMTTTVSPSQFFVAGSVSGTVPYYESFEGVQMDDRLPNCSWYSANLGGSVKSYLSAQSGNRVPRSGSKFASFTAPASNAYVYTHPLYMEAGVTYSAGIWYTTEYFGGTNWSDLSIHIGPNQNPTGLVQIASTSPAVSGPHKDLGGVFTVPSSGFYHVAVRATGSGGSAPYLSWDDLEVTIPCQGPGAVNSPTLSLSVSSNTVCANDMINLAISGADTYTWSNGSNQNSIGETALFTSTYTVMGTNTLTGCSSTETTVIHVNPAPLVYVFANTSSVCPGGNVFLTAVGAISYAWSHGPTGPNAVANPNTTTMFSVIGTNQFGCTGTDSKQITVGTLPSVFVNSSNNVACKDDQVNLTATGAQTYLWYNNQTSVVYQGSNIFVNVKTPTTFTVVGTNGQGCSKSSTLFQDVEACTGLSDLTANQVLGVYPNPTTGTFRVDMNSAADRVLTVSDLSGRVIIKNVSDQQSVEMNINELAAGVYYLSVESKDSKTVLKIVKN